jgi:uncharacterized membrane protein YccC
MAAKAKAKPAASKSKSARPAGAKKELTSLALHPSAAPSIRRAKAIGGLVGFMLAVLIGLSNGEPFSSLALRAVELGIVGHLVAWAASVAIWRRVLTAHATTRVREVQEERRRRLAIAMGEETAE